MIFGNNGNSIFKTGNTMFSSDSKESKSLTQTGNAFFRNDGKSGSTIGSNTFFGGKTITQCGNSFFRSDGVTYTLCGKVLTSNRGKTWTGVETAADAKKVIMMDM